MHNRLETNEYLVKANWRERDGLYTTLPLPILYGVWHTQGGSEGGGVYCAMVVHTYMGWVTWHTAQAATLAEIAASNSIKSVGNAGGWGYKDD